MWQTHNRTSENDVCFPPSFCSHCGIPFLPECELRSNTHSFVVTKQQHIGTCSTNIHFRVSRNIFLSTNHHVTLESLYFSSLSMFLMCMCVCITFVPKYLSLVSPHTSAYLRISPHISANFCIFLHTSAYFCILLHISAYFCKLPHISTYFCISPHTCNNLRISECVCPYKASM